MPLSQGIEKEKVKENIVKTDDILFWNVAGLLNKDSEVWEYLKRFNFIGLIETWIDEIKWEKIKKQMPKGYIWKCQPAKKIHKMGRPAGGIITGVKKDWSRNEDEIEVEGLVQRKIKIGDEKWNIWTIYCAEGIKKLEQKIEEGVIEDDEILVLGGDLNARIGEEGQIYEGPDIEEQSVRQSKDKKINAEGEKLIQLIEKRGWFILNGNINGDECGEFTFISKKGTTVIDYVFVNNKGWDRINYLQIDDRTESDHQPLTVNIKTGEERRFEEEDEEKNTKELVIWNEETINSYRERTENKIFDKQEINEIWEELKLNVKEELIRKTIKWEKNKIGHRKWWDNDCKEQKKQVKRIYKEWKNGKIEKESYLIKRQELRKLVKEKEEEFKEKELQEIQQIKSESQIWKYINKRRNKKKKIVENNIKLEDWRKHFISLLNGSEEKAKGQERIKKDDEEEELDDIEIEVQIIRLKKKKAVGSDEIPGEAWSYSGINTYERLKELIKRIWKGERFPEEWKRGVIVPLHKKGCTENTDNYRGITILNTAYKIYAAILNERLKKDIKEKNIFNDTQAGFREHRSAVDNAYILHHVIEREIMKKGGKIFAFFIDLKAAFDRVSREELWRVMEERGIRRGLIERTKEIYEEVRNVVRIGEEISEEFWTSTGVKQGCVLSPTLFTIFLSDLEDEIKKSKTEGIKIGERRFWTLAYADDVVLVANKEGDLRSMMSKLEDFLERRKLVLNVDKSKIMIFGKGRGKKKKARWYWKGKKLETVKEFVYLGFKLQRNGDMKLHIRERIKKASIVMKEVWGLGERMFKDEFVRRLFLFEYLIASILTYGAEIFGWREWEELEAVQVRYIKWCLGLEWCTPGYIVLEESKREKLKIRTGIRALTYEEKIEKVDGLYLLKECLKEKKKIRTRNGIERTEYLRRIGYSQEGFDQLKASNLNEWEIVRNNDRDLQAQLQYNKIRDSKFNWFYKYIRSSVIPEYLIKQGKKDSQKIMAKVRCGCFEEKNKYWRTEDEKKCSLCELECGTMKHLVEDCTEINRIDCCVEEIYGNKFSEKIVDWLRLIENKRKEKKKLKS